MSKLSKESKNYSSDLAPSTHDYEIKLDAPQKTDIRGTLQDEAMELSHEERFKILATTISRLAPGIYVEPIEYRPLGLSETIPNSIFTFFFHVPYNIPITQYNLVSQNVLLKRSFIGLIVEPPKYEYIREVPDSNVDLTRFQVWKRDMARHPVYKQYMDFCEKYNWYMFSELYEHQFFSYINQLIKFNGKVAGTSGY
jgi:hypothetical protein